MLTVPPYFWIFICLRISLFITLSVMNSKSLEFLQYLLYKTVPEIHIRKISCIIFISVIALFDSLRPNKLPKIIELNKSSLVFLTGQQRCRSIASLNTVLL